MTATKKVEHKSRRRAPATTPEAREKQLIALAYDAVEKRIREGKASSQELVHFLKMGSTREELEKENLEMRKELMAAKTDSLQSMARMEELTQQAIDAFRVYSGAHDNEQEEY